MSRAVLLRCFGHASWVLVAIAATSSRSSELPVQDLADSLRRCVTIDRINERVACYDAIAGRPTTPKAAAPTENFGLNPIQRPTVEEAPRAITARVTGLGRSAGAHRTIRLDNDQLWEVEADDAVLAPGDLVTIRHAALASYLLTTPQSRTYRVRRLH